MNNLNACNRISRINGFSAYIAVYCVGLRASYLTVIKLRHLDTDALDWTCWNALVKILRAEKQFSDENTNVPEPDR